MSLGSFWNRITYTVQVFYLVEASSYVLHMLNFNNSLGVFMTLFLLTFSHSRVLLAQHASLAPWLLGSGNCVFSGIIVKLERSVHVSKDPAVLSPTSLSFFLSLHQPWSLEIRLWLEADEWVESELWRDVGVGETTMLTKLFVYPWISERVLISFIITCRL
jgi:hypothetical protein